MPAEFIGVGGPEHDVHHIGKLRQNCRQGIEHILDALIGREQAEGEQNGAAFYLELIFEVGRIHESHIGNTMGDQIDLVHRSLVDIVQHLSSAIGHDHQPGREGDQFFHHPPLVRLGFAQDGMQGGDYGHFQLPQHGQDVATDRAAEYAELMLQANHINIADVEEIRSAQVRGQILFFDLEAHYFGIVVSVLYVVDRGAETLAFRIRVLYR